MRPLAMIRRGVRRATGHAEPAATLPVLTAEQVYVVTGASAGIGAETARGLARAGASVVVVGRNPTRTEGVVLELRERYGRDRVHLELADFSDLDQVRTLGERLLGRHRVISGLVNNAGLWHPKRRVSIRGLEETWAVNHLATFLLTRVLQDRLIESCARVVTVSSRLHETCVGVDLDDPGFDRRPYRGLEAYAQSKLANVQFALELARRTAGTGLTSSAVHPGDVATDVVRDSALLSLGSRLVRPLLLTPEEGAQTSLYAVAAAETHGRTGAYYAACAQTQPSGIARDPDAAAALWTLSERQVGL